jgi:hypothetical protein
MGDVTSGCTLKVHGQMAGANFAIIQTAADVDDGDTIELEDVLDSNGGVKVKQVLGSYAVQDPTGTPVLDPMGYTDTTDTLTIGGSTDNKRRDVHVWWK